MARRFKNSDEALTVQENDLKCRDRARKWGMEESAKKWQASADHAQEEWIRLTEEEFNASRRNH
ncbi:hypothetical protein EKH77_17075 [Streptomyces luteoverticillatus]|uniref:Uncharacterized protein n=1 Tax=Streptomyces luteoverticillatus TaxID=66425 RepID=A0A3S9PK46_STRLT|nr:hypothetical protein [Streptomyces luteoverticillatus]AZQ72704.1 hypothetical protein EKH77_17075 [Streptomyces luteoverticillatus]